MTDTEIIRFVEHAMYSAKGEDGFKEIYWGHFKDILDLINRQKAEIEDLREDNRKQFDSIQELKIFTEKQDVEIEILNSNYEKLHIKYDNALNDSKYYKRLHETAKSEAIKEFWDKLKKEADFISGGDYGFSFEIREDVAEDIIKEIIGDK